MKEKKEEDCYTCSNEREEERRFSIPTLMKEKKEEDCFYLL